MTLSKEAIQEFKELFKKRFKKEISDQEAFDRGMRLLNMYKVVYGESIRDENKPQEKQYSLPEISQK